MLERLSGDQVNAGLYSSLGVSNIVSHPLGQAVQTGLDAMGYQRKKVGWTHEEIVLIHE